MTLKNQVQKKHIFSKRIFCNVHNLACLVVVFRDVCFLAVYPGFSLCFVHYRVTLLKSWNPESSDVLSSVSFLNTEIVTRSISCCSSSLKVIMCDGFVHVVALHIDSEVEFSIFLVEKNFLNFFCLYFFFVFLSLSSEGPAPARIL